MIRRPGRARGFVPTWILGVLLALGPAAEGVAPRDTAPFPQRSFSHMSALLEKTLFKVDVLTLDVRVDSRTAGRLQSLAEGADYSDHIAGAVSRTVLTAPEVWVRMVFLRGVSQKQFLNGIKDNMKTALEAGLIDTEYYEDTLDNLPEWYDFLEDRRIQKGDAMVYWVHGDTLDSTYHGTDGDVLLDMRRENPKGRYGVLGSYFAPKSDFRKNLVRSLLETE